MPTSALLGVLLAVAAAAVLAPAAAEELRASVTVDNGVPRLRLNGRPTPPILFFYNTDVPGARRQAYLARQVGLAAEAGVHLYSLPLRFPRMPDGITPNFAYADSLLDRFIAADPEAMFLVRVYPGLNPQWRRWKELPEGEIATFADGSKGEISIASEAYARSFEEDLRAMIRHLEGSPYANRVFCYHPGGPNSENFHDGYREKGPDYSAANQRGFRQWLRARYRTDAALRRSWGRPDVTLESAAIPAFEPGRFPMHGGVRPVPVFYDLPREQEWVDFSEYSNEMVAECILRWARQVKAETRGRKLTAFFYGYTMELPGSFSGHYALQRVLECPDVDILAAPCSYVDRLPGGSGGYMSLVDTITAHGKLWINEDDTRTCLVKAEDVPNWGLAGPLLSPVTDDLPGTAGVLDRNLASVLAHRAGTWWMDLFAANAFDEPSLWRMLRARKALYEEVYRRPTPFRPEVAILIDERAKNLVKSDWDANAWTMYALRDESAKVGASVGYYSLDDFIAGVVPPCRVYVFGNAFRLTDRQVAAIPARLDREGAVAVWAYAPGLLGPEGLDPARTGKLTGISVAVSPGAQGSEGVGLLEGEQWGVGCEVVPRLHVTDASARVLGRYRADGLVSAAEARAGRHRAIFLADIKLSAGVLRKVCESAGVHLWTRGGEVVQTDGALLAVHSGRAGACPIFLPPGIDAEPLGGAAVTREGRTLHAPFRRGDTLWFRLRRGGERGAP